ncbi:MAG TPA: coproporphyrinogen III oxidase, partial [Alphaproteobacteria bacterium]|nr:coproporphyrinogen III oxidase [Alphaproteobacteria bacterium]
RNFQGYTDDPSRTILGFGLSSITQFEGAYIQNTTDAPTYRKQIESGAFPITRYLELTEDDLVRRALIERLMCDFALRFEDFETVNVPRAQLSLLAQDGIIEMDDDGLLITAAGKAFTRVVAACFDPYFNKDSGRHAKAI